MIFMALIAGTLEQICLLRGGIEMVVIHPRNAYDALMLQHYLEKDGVEVGIVSYDLKEILKFVSENGADACIFDYDKCRETSIDLWFLQELRKIDLNMKCVAVCEKETAIFAVGLPFSPIDERLIQPFTEEAVHRLVECKVLR